VSAVTKEYLTSILDYDPATGDFRWRHRDDRRSAWNSRHAGTVAGAVNTRGHIQIRIEGVLFLSHRLAWLYMTGEWPAKSIDHINNVGTDNRFSNLRPADAKDQVGNSKIRMDNTSGVKGVYWNRSLCKWAAGIKIDGKQTHLGSFIDKEKAATAYERAARSHFGEFAKPARRA
jgi:hypothetical protein